MCDNCKDIILREHFYSPRDYFNCLAYIKSLIKEDKFTLIQATCPIDNVKDEDGVWYSDIIFHTIQCNKCKQSFECFADTYHGGGSFTAKDNG